MQDAEPLTAPSPPALFGLGNRPWRDGIIVFAVMGISYYFLGRLALNLLSDESVAVFWPASGLAAGAVAVLYPAARWPTALAVLTATIVANLHTRTSLPLTLIFALCNAAECLAFGMALQALDRSRPHLESLGSVAAFVGAAVLGAGLVALPAAIAIQQFGLSPAPLSRIWLSWFQSDFLGIVALAPLLMTLPAAIARQVPRAKNLEGLLAVAVATAAAFITYAYVYGGALALTAPTIVLLPLFIWLAARTPGLFSALAAASIALIIVIQALSPSSGFGPPPMPLQSRLNESQVALLSTSLALLILSAMFARSNNFAKALASSDQRLKLALAGEQIYAFEQDAVTGLVHREGGLAKRLGLPEVSLQSAYLDILTPESRRAFTAMVEQASPAGPDLTNLFQMRAKDGRTLLVEYRARAEFDDDANLLRIRGMFLDVTERETARVEKVERERVLLRALKAGRVLTFEHDLITDRVTRSENAAEILGVPPAQINMSRDEFMEFIHPEDRPLIASIPDRLTPAQPFLQNSYRFRRSDGTTAWLEVTSSGDFDEHRRLIKVSGLVRDVTEKEERERQLGRVLEAGHVSTFEHDLIRGISRRSENAAEIFGLPPEKIHMSRDEFISYIHPDDRSKLTSRTGRMTPSRPFNTESYRFVRPDGKYVWVEVMASGEFSSDGRLTRVTGVARDVTERRLARLDRDKRELELRRVLDAARIFTFEHDLITGKAVRSENAAGILGVSEADAQAPREQFLNFVHREDRSKLATYVKQLTPDSPFCHGTYRFHRPQGSIALLELSASGTFDDRGSLIKLSGLTRDVTEREEARARLEQREEQLRGALVAGRAYAFSFDEVSRSVRRSDNAAEVLGVPLALAQSDRDLMAKHVHPDDRQLLAEFQSWSSDSAKSKTSTCRFMRPDGRMIWLQLTANVTFGTDGKLATIRGLVRDVTAQVRSEQRQALLIKELDHRVKNALARMDVVIKSSRETHQTLDDYVQAIQARIASMARTQERLSRNKWTGASIDALVADELAPYRTDDNCRIEGPSHLLEPDAAQAFAFTVHELATNAAKYGALSRPGGRVEIVWSVSPDASGDASLELSWREHAPGSIEPPAYESYGLKTIRNRLSYEHDATVDLQFSPSGLHCTIEMPLPAPADASDIGLSGLRKPALAAAG